MAFAGRVKEVLRTGLHQPALEAHKTECNFFLMINKGCFGIENGELRTENEAALVVDYPSLVVSQGPVAPVGFGAVAPTPPIGHPSLEGGDGAMRAIAAHPASSTSHLSALTFHLEKNPEHRRANADDKVFVAMFCAETGEAMLSLPAYRRSKAITVVLPDEWVGMEVHLYGFVQDNNGRTSDSVYLGEWNDLSAAVEVDVLPHVAVVAEGGGVGLLGDGALGGEVGETLADDGGHLVGVEGGEIAGVGASDFG